MGRNNKIIQSIDIIIFSVVLFIYNCLIVVGGIFLIPILPLLVLINPRSKAIFEKFRISMPKTKILVHGASVGEHNGTLPLKNYFNSISFSVNTITGCNKLRKNNVKCFFMPHDIPIFMYIFLKNVKILVITESEFLPNTILLAYLMGKKLILLNGRISKKRLFLYSVLKPFYKVLFSFFTYIYVANEVEKKNFSIFTNYAQNMGNLKYSHLTLKEKRDEKFILLASSHGDDEKILKEALKDINTNFPIVIAPRHIERVNEIKKLFEPIKRVKIYSDLRHIEENYIYIVNKMGIMNELYAHSLLTIMGGTFSKKIGGHNPLEPIEYENKIVFGSYTYNFSIEYNIIYKNNLGYKIKNIADLKKILMMARKESKKEQFYRVLEYFQPKINKIIKNIMRIYQ